jgi:UDP:flavonoid glycosyltransferase YjiC (YdhE family)
VRRALLVWEHGDNLGHVAPLAALARRLRGAGWEVHAAVQRLDVAGAFLADVVDVWHQAPLWPHSAGDAPVPLGWPDLLRPFGWSRAADLALLVGAWRSLLAGAAPDVIVADAAPTALLAARGRVRAVSFSHGFSLPPKTTPLPPLRWWAPPPPEAVALREAFVLDVVNGAAGRLGDPPLASLADLFDAGPRLGQGTPLTDHYGPLRPPGDLTWVGPAAALDAGEAARWPDGDGPRVFAYLSARHPALPRVLAALDGSGARVLAHVRGLLPPWRRDYRRISFADGPVRIREARAEADAAVCHSVAGTGSAFLAVGVPVLALPTQLEQEMAARAAADGGGVRLVLPSREARWSEALAEVTGPAVRAEAAALPRWEGPPAEDVVLEALGD